MPKLVVATSNAHKTAEIQAFLGSDWQVSDLSDLPKDSFPEEDGQTFAENALIKAEAAALHHTEAMVLADDSGLEVDVLGGEPGIYSARYSGPDATDADNRTHLTEQLAQRGAKLQPWLARFQCSLALIEPGEPERQVFEGTVEGQIRPSESGGGGFGYDPLFQPDGYDDTFGILPESVKNEISHRARAMAKLKAYLDGKTAS